ncbi:MAG: ABC transporter substrate-binding protein [Candidatus Hadarchaeaceae archaeon]
MKREIVSQGTIVIAVVAIIALIIGAAAGYILKPAPEKPPEIAELEAQVSELEATIDDLEAEIAGLEATLAAIPGGDISMEPASFVWAVDTWLFSMPVRAAFELGYFEDEGLTVELHDYAMGIATIDAILAGDAQMGIAASYALDTRLGKGDVCLVSFFNKWRTPSGLLVAPDIKSLADLKGKTGAVVSGSIWDYFWGKTLEKAGLTAEDVEILSFASPADYLASAMRGDVDAAWWWEAGLTNAQEQLKDWHMLLYTKDAAPAAIDGWGVIPAKESWARENPDVVARALRAMKKGADFCNQNPELAGEIAEDHFGLPAEDAAEMIPFQIYYAGLSGEYAEGMYEMLQWGWEQGLIEEEYDFYAKIVSEPLEKIYPELVTYK